MTFEVTQIGTVRNDFETPVGPEEMADHESTIVIDEEYTEGLYRIADNDYVTVLWYLHESGEPSLRGPRRYGTERGIFACRSPNRPSPIGTTTVELLDREGRELRVHGLDAIDGTPVLDIKPYAPNFDRPDHVADRRENHGGRIEGPSADRDGRAREVGGDEQ